MVRQRHCPTAADVTIGGNGPSSYGTTSCGTPSGNTLTCTNTYTPTAADTPGSYTESASFSGDAHYTSSSSPETNNFTINSATAATSVACTPNPSAYGASVTCTATINGEFGLLKGRRGVKRQDVTGTVAWSANTGCGTTTVTRAILESRPAPRPACQLGSDTVTGTYSGDSNHSGSSGSTSQVVNQAATLDQRDQREPGLGSLRPGCARSRSRQFCRGLAAARRRQPMSPSVATAPAATEPRAAARRAATRSLARTPIRQPSRMERAPTRSRLPSRETPTTPVRAARRRNNFSIGSATAATTVTSSLNPSGFGESVTFTASINGEYGLLKGRKRSEVARRNRNGGLERATRAAARPR